MRGHHGRDMRIKDGRDGSSKMSANVLAGAGLVASAALVVRSNEKGREREREGQREREKGRERERRAKERKTKEKEKETEEIAKVPRKRSEEGSTISLWSCSALAFSLPVSSVHSTTACAANLHTSHSPSCRFARCRTART